MATIKWIGANGDWHTATNWDAAATPGPSDNAILDIAGNYTVSVTAPFNVLSVAVNNGGTSLSVRNGSAAAVAAGLGNIGTLNVDAGGADPGGSSLALGGTLSNSGTVNIGNNGFGGSGITQATTVSTTGLANTGTINVRGNTNPGGARAILDVAAPAGFGTAGTLSGTVNVFTNGLIEFASGGIAGIADNAILNLQSGSGFVALSGNTNSNSALSGLARNDGQLVLAHGAAVNTNTGFANSGLVEVDYWFFATGGSSFNIGGTLKNSGDFRIGFSDTNIVASTTVTATGLDHTGFLGIGGNVASNSRGALDIAAAAPTILTGQIELSGLSLLHYASGGIAGVGRGAQLTIFGSNAFLASGADTSSNSALTALTGNAGGLSLYRGASVTTLGGFSNTGTLRIDDFFSAGGSSLNVGGVLANSGTALIGNTSGSFTAPVAITASGFSNTGTFSLAGSSVANTSSLTANGGAGNFGTLNVEAFGILQLTPGQSFTQSSGTARVSGTLNAPTAAVVGGLLDVRGTVNTAAVALMNGALGGNAGTLVGNVNQTGGSVLLGTNSFDQPADWTIGGNYAANGGLLEQVLRGTAADLVGTLTVNGNVNLAGTIFQADVSAFSLAAGQTFRVMNFTPGNLTGTFSAIRIGDFIGNGTSANIGGGRSINLVYDNAAGHIDLNVVNTPAGGSHWLAGSGNWTTAAQWDTNAVPGAADDVIIDAGSNYVITVNSAVSANSITVATNATLAMSAAGATETVTTFLTNAGTVNVDSAGGQGGTTLNIGGRLSNGDTVNIGNTALSAATNVNAAELVNFGTFNVTGSATTRAALNIAAAAGFGTAGNLTGTVNLNGDALIRFASGQITSIAAGGQLFLNGSMAHVANAADTTTNSALTGLARNSGWLDLINTAAVTVVGDLLNENDIIVDRVGSGGSSLTIAGTLTNTDLFQVGNGNLSSPTTVSAGGLINSDDIQVMGSAANQATFNIAAAAGFGTTGILTGSVLVSGRALLGFASGQITTIANTGSLVLDGANARVANASDTNSNSALTGLTSVEGSFELLRGSSVNTSGPLSISGSLQLDRVFTGGSSLTVSGVLTNSGFLQVGNTNITAPDTVSAAGLVNTGDIQVMGNAAAQSSLNIAAAAGFGTASVLTGDVLLRGNALLGFASGQITEVANNSSLILDGANARIANASNTAINSALTGLTSILGAVEIINGATVTTTGPLTNSGSLELDRVFTGGSSLTIGGLLTNTGFLKVGGGGLTASDNLTAAGLVNSGEIQLFGTAAGQGMLTVNGAATDTGTMTIGANANLAVTGGNAFVQAAGITHLTGAVTAANYNLMGGQIDGNGGTVAGNLNQSAGLLLVGINNNTPGSLNVQGNLSESSTGVVEVVLKGTGAGQFSTINVGGGVNLAGGTLQFDLGTGFNFALGQTFDLVTFAPGQLSGSFGATRFGNLTGSGDGVGIGNGLGLFVDYDNAGGEIELQVVNALVNINAPATLHAFTQWTSLIAPLSVTDNDPDSPLTMTLVSGVGALSAVKNGAGTVTGAGTTSLTLAGSLAELNTMLASVTYTGGAPNSLDQIVMRVTDENGTSAPTTIAVDVDSIPITTPVLHVGDVQTLIPGRPSALVGLSVSDPYSEATGQNLTLRFQSGASNDIKLSATDGVGGTVTGQGTNDLQITGTVDEINSYLIDPSVAELAAKYGGAATLGGLLLSIASLVVFRIAQLAAGLMPEEVKDLRAKAAEEHAKAQQWYDIGNFSQGNIHAALANKYDFQANLLLVGKVTGLGFPHLQTALGNLFAFDAVGEFTLARSVEPGDTFEVQVRLEPYSGSSSASVITQVALKLGVDRVTFDVSRPDFIWVNGNPINVGSGTTALAAGNLTHVSSGSYVVNWNTGESVQITNRGDHLDIGVDAQVSRAGSLAGLIGASESTNSDFVLPDGTALSTPLSAATLYGTFANAWRVTDQTSLLDYAAGQTTATFTNLGAPLLLSLSDFPSDLVTKAAHAVAAAGITNPVLAAAAAYDFIVSGGQHDVLSPYASEFRVPPTQASITTGAATAAAIGVIAHDSAVLASSAAATPLVFDVYLTNSRSTDTFVNFNVVDGGAGFIDASAFGGTFPSGQIVILAGQTVGHFTVNLPQNALGSFPSEELAVQIASPDGLPIFSPTAELVVHSPPQAGPPPVPEFAFLSTLGTFTHLGNHFTLDLGEVRAGQPVPPLQFALNNLASPPSDSINGTFDVLPVGAGFTVSGANLASPIAAGESYRGLTVNLVTGVFDTGETPFKFGFNEEVITFHPVDTNAAGYAAPMPDIDLTIKYTLVEQKEVFSYAYGDVHIITYDALHYDFQGVGEFILAKSRVDSFEIQMRLEPYEFNNKAVSIMSAAAATVGSDRVTFDVERPDTVWVNGAPTTLSLANPTLNLAAGQITQLTPYFFHVTWNTGEEMWVENSTSFGPGSGAPAHLNISDSVPVGLPGFIGGLQGFAQGPEQDFQFPDGTVLTQPLDCHFLYGEYADAWRVTQATSLFDYGPGQTTDTFTILDFPINCYSLDDLPPELVAHAMELALEICGDDPVIAAAMAYDYLFTGDPTFLTDGAIICQQGVPGTAADITMDPAPLAAGIAANELRFTEAAVGPTHATFTVFLTQNAVANTVVNYTVAAPDPSFLDAAEFGGTLPSGQVTVLAGQRTAQLTIDVPQGALGNSPTQHLEVEISTPGGQPLVAAQAQTEIVNDNPLAGAPAVPLIAYMGNVGTFSHVGNAYTLDLGGLTQGELVDPLQFAVVNATLAPGDELDGTFSVPTGNGFTVIGNHLDMPIEPGRSYQGLFFTTQTNVLGPHNMTVTFHPLDVNDSGYSQALADITLTVTDSVAAAARAAINTPDRIIFPNVRVGTPQSQHISISNTALAGAGSLDVTATASGDATVTGALSMLAPGATDYTSLDVGLETDEPGARSGYVTLDAMSNGGGGNTMAIEPDKHIDVFGSVYRIAAAAVTGSNMVVHVGDPGTAALTVTNSTLADGYSENLIAAITGATGNVQIGATGPTGQIQPGASDTSSLTLNFSTAQAALIPTTVTVALTSDGGLGTGSIDGLGQLALAPQAVPLNIAVNNFAQAAWVKLSGGGTFSQNGLNYTLDLGSFVHNAPAVTVNLGALNPAAGPADLLSGTFQIAGSNALSTAGFGAFSGFGAGQQNGVGTLTLQTGTPGIFSKTITLHPTGSNASGFSAPLADETLTISAIVFASAPSIAVGADHATTTDIGGFAPPGSTVQLFENGVLTPVATGVTGADSGFNLPMPRFADGPHFLTATSTDGVSPSLFSSPATVVVQNSGTSAAQIHTDISFTLAADERYLTLMGNASLTGIGNALDNIIYGNSAPNVLAAGAGNDLIVSRSGRDTIDGGPGFNSVSWTELSQAVDIDLANPANSDSAVTNVQVFTLTNSADTFVGAGSPVFVYGLDGDDDIKGSTSGGDFIVPGRGHNTIDGGGGEFDVISFQDRTTGVHIDLSNPANSDAVITGVNDFHLTNQDDTFIAGATTVYVYAFGGHDHIIGSPQSDFIDPGRDGGTTVEGGGGFDYVSFFTAPAGITLNLADPTQNTGAAIGDVFHNIGEFILTPHDDTFIGLTSGQNIVLDYSGNNHILGGLNANNLLFSGPGNDFLQGGILGDTLSGGAGNDTYAFGTLKPAASFPNAHLYAASILDFVSGEDKFQFDDTAFGIAAGTSFVEGSTFVTGTLSSQPANTTTAPTLLYYTDAGLLYFDPDGTGSQEVHLLAQILGAPTLHGSDFVTL